MKFGMTPEQYALLERLVLAPLKAIGCRVYIFGSRSTGKHHSHSDVDILYVPPNDHSLPAGLLSGIREQIDESRFPYVVELVAEENLVESYRPSVFKSRIEI